jgi:hypothetical protein
MLTERMFDCVAFGRRVEPGYKSDADLTLVQKRHLTRNGSSLIPFLELPVHQDRVHPTYLEFRP